jgi:hypothetical protein
MVFISSQKLVDADGWVKKNYSKYLNGFKARKIKLSIQEIGRLTNFLGGDECHQQYVTIFHKFARTKVHVPLGWVHNICNIQPCVKFAWDFLQMEILKDVVQVNHLSKNIMKNAIDYMVVIQVLFLARNTLNIAQT